MHRVIHFLKTAKRNLINFDKKIKNYQAAKPKNRLNEINNRLIRLEKMCRNIDYKQNLIMDYFMNPADAKQATGAMRIRQLQNLELLQEFVRICNMHNISYWLDFGSLLGARRHGGVVPWDDDMDVSMLKDDFKIFKNIVSKEINPKYKLQYLDGKQYRIIFTEKCGAFLDILLYNQVGDKIFTVPNFITKSYNIGVDKKIIFPLTKADFENTEVNIPNDIDSYLNIRYGNWQVLPKAVHAEGGHNPIG